MIAKNKKTTKNRQDLFFAILLGTLFLVVVGYLVVSNLKINIRRNELNSQLVKLQQQLYELESKKSQLQTEISRATQEEYVEREARETLNLKKPGEEVVTVLPAENNQTSAFEISLWQKIIDKLKFW